MKQIIIGTLFLITGLFTFTTPSVAAPSKPAKSAWQGTATGSFSVNGKTVTLKYAYSMEEPDSFDDKATVISVLLTQEPLPQDAFKTESLFFAIDKTKPGILYTVDKTGETRNEVIIHPGIESGGAQFSGLTTGKMKFSKKTAKQVDGNISVKDGKPSYLEFKYAAKVTFSAPLMQAMRKAASLDASTGKGLPDDGGEPGKALFAFISAIRKKDLTTIRSMAPAEIRKYSDEELGPMLDMLGGMYPKDLKIIRGFAKDDFASLYVSGTGDDGKEYGIIDMQKNSGTWIIDNQKWSNKSFDEK
jgi:hypothetical protein